MTRGLGVLNEDALRLVDLYLIPAIASDDPTAIKIAMGKIQEALNTGWPDSRVEDMARETATAVDRQHAHGFYGALGIAIGVKVMGTDVPSMAASNGGILGQGGGNPPNVPPGFLGAPGGPTRIPTAPSFGVRVSVAPSLWADDYVRANKELIGKLRNGIVPGLEDAVVRARQFGLEGQVRGETPDELARRLRAIWEKNGVPAQLPTTRLKANGEPVMLSTFKHANMVAEDQLAKLNANLTEARQVASGIDSYTWRTRGDDKVRPRHRELEGQVFTWASGGAPGEGHAGHPPRCRCVSEPLINRDQILRNLVPL